MTTEDLFIDKFQILRDEERLDMKSLMFVPSKPKMLEKILTSEADACIIDLEDSINEKDKQQALKDACSFLATSPDKSIFVRVDSNYLQEELYKLSDYAFRGYMIPKFETPNAYMQYAPYFKGKDIIALVETPMGIVNLKEICSSPDVTIIAFGAEDFSSSIGMKNCAESLTYARSAIVTYGKAYGKVVIDTPSFILDDMKSLEQEIQLAVDLGFDGKLSIHPKQIKTINEMFQYFDLDKIIEVIRRYEMEGEAVLRMNDKVYEKMHIAHFKRILKEHGIKIK